MYVVCVVYVFILYVIIYDTYICCMYDIYVIYDVYVICSDYSKYFTKKNVINSLKKIQDGTFFSKDEEEFIESEKNSIERLKYIYSDYF